MKQNDKAKKAGAAKILARKKASKDRDQAAAMDYVRPDSAREGYSPVEQAGDSEESFENYNKRVRNANAKANKGMVSQTVTGYTPGEATSVDDDGSVSTWFERDVKQYEADNKGVSASRGREIKEKARQSMKYGTGEIRAHNEAIRDVNRYGNDSIITPGKIARKGMEKAYKEALHATWDHSRPLNKAEKAEKQKLKKARSRGDLGRGSQASKDFSLYDN